MGRFYRDADPGTGSMLAGVSVRGVTIFAVASPYAWDVLESATRSHLEARCVDNIGGADERLPTVPVDSVAGEDFTLGLSSAHGRALAAADAVARGLGRPVALVDPTAVVAGTTEVAHGAYVNAGAVIASNSRIGCHANVNRSASVGHDTALGFAASVGPGAVLTGGVTVEAQAFVGAGATVLPGITIGTGAVVGAGSVVTADVPPGTIVAGNPARVLRTQPIEDWETVCPHSSMH
jgi:sugar O-acyltransferase (sialic acid O-acetyltransferase NeuD family)